MYQIFSTHHTLQRIDLTTSKLLSRQNIVNKQSFTVCVQRLYTTICHFLSVSDSFHLKGWYVQW